MTLRGRRAEVHDRPVSVAGGTLGYRRSGTSGAVHVLLSGGPGLESAYLDPVGDRYGLFSAPCRPF